MNKNLSFANIFKVFSISLGMLIVGCSNQTSTVDTTANTVVENEQTQIKTLLKANQTLYTQPGFAKKVSQDAENWSTSPKGEALKVWLHTQRQANRGDYDQAWRMIHQVDIKQLPKQSQKEASTLYWHLATILNSCPQWPGTHLQQFTFLTMNENTNCEQQFDKPLIEFANIMKNPEQSDWAGRLVAWHQTYSDHWANQYIQWHKLSASPHQSKEIAVLLPLTGEYAKIGKEIQNGMLTLHPFLNQVTLSFHDTAELGASAAYKEATKTSPNIIIGPLTSQEMQAISPKASMPMITFAQPRANSDQVVTMTHDPYQIPKLLDLSKQLGHEHLVWLTDPSFSQMQAHWPNSVARFAKIPIQSDKLKNLLLVDQGKQVTNTNLIYDGLIILGHDTYDLQTVAHEFLVNPIQTFMTGPDLHLQTSFYENTVALKGLWLDNDSPQNIAYSPFRSIYAQLNAYNQSWYNAIGIDALLYAYRFNEINAMKTPITMASGMRQRKNNVLSLGLVAHHVQDGKWHPLLTLDSV